MTKSLTKRNNENVCLSSNQLRTKKRRRKMKKFMKVIRQIVEKICVIITIILVYENALIFYQHLFPYWWSHGYYLKFFFHIIIGHWLLLNTAIHYYLAISTYPGFVADLKEETTVEDESNYTKCSKCNVMRPPRAHHCKVCEKCVLRYDHHCPWINNCVGYRNHVHFLLFCVYMTMIAGYSTLFARRDFQRVMFHDEVLFGLFAPILQPNNLTTVVIEHNTIGPITGVLTLFLFITNLVAMSLIFGLTVWQMKLITKGQTCVEEKIDKSSMTKSAQQYNRRPYNLGWKQNWETFFEISNSAELIIRLLIPFPFQPKHHGKQWISKKDD